MSHRSPLPAAAAVALVLGLALAGCDGGGFLTRGDGGPGGVPGDGGAGDLLGPGQCLSNRECKGGVCVAGRCCPSAKRVCGRTCCAAGAACFANVCVVPGKLCVRNQDCPKGHYCERAFGDKKPPPKPGCRSLPTGRCVKLPPPCPSPGKDAGPGRRDAGAPGGCIKRCEYRPPPGKLSATVKWRWGGRGTARVRPDAVDVWQTPVVGRVADTNCDGKVDRLDPPNVIFVSGNARGTYCGAAKACRNGVLRVLDGATGREVWSLERAHRGSQGFAGVSLALGDFDGDGLVEIAAVTGEAKIAIIDGKGRLERLSDRAIPKAEDPRQATFGWGGGLTTGDMDGDGAPEIAYGSTVFTTAGGKLRRRFTGTPGMGGALSFALSVIADLDGKPDGKQELLAGNTAYTASGRRLWWRADIPDGLPGLGDLDKDGRPEAIIVSRGRVYVVDAATGRDRAASLKLPGTGSGGPPTVADFDGDGRPEIGVAMATFYSVVKPDLARRRLRVLWSQQNHDLSSSVTGSTVFDFEGDGKAEVIYNDECFLWVYDGKTGKVKFTALTTSFTATEASLVADVDGDGHAEIVMISNGADPSRWRCNIPPWTRPDPRVGRPAWKPPKGGKAYRGLTVFGDRQNSWVGTRTLWNQHAYYVSNVCDDRDSACPPPNRYGSIPRRPRRNWTIPWLNNFRQNVQEKGLFDAPDATVTLTLGCTVPMPARVFVRNLGAAILPKGVEVGLYVLRSGKERLLATLKTTTAIFPGGAEELRHTIPKSTGITTKDTFIARIVDKGKARTFNECRTGNNASPPTKSPCGLK